MLKVKSIIGIFSLALMGLSLMANAGELLSKDQLVEMLNPKPIPSRSMNSNQTPTFAPNAGRANISEVQFELNSDQLTARGLIQVDQLGQAMKELDSLSFDLIGHTDASGSDDYNLTLSERRANTVYNYLVQRYGIDPTRLTTAGKGESALYDPQNPNAAENRRVEVINTQFSN